MGTPAAPAPAPMELAVVLRPYRGPQDHPAMTEVANAVDLYNGAPAGRSVEGMDTYYAHLEHADLPRDCVIVELDGAVVAYGRASLEVLASGDAKVGAILNIRPDVRGRGIEERLVEHALARGRAIAVDEKIGQGHAVMFAIRPFWRWQTQGTYTLGFNTIMNWNDLDAGKAPAGGRGTASQPQY